MRKNPLRISPRAANVCLHLRAREILVAIVDRFELAAVDGDARLRQKAYLSANGDELRAHLAYRRPVILAEIGNRLVISARSWSISTPFDGGGGAELYPCGREARHIAVRAQLHDTKVGDAPGSSVTDPHDTAPVAPTEEGERLLKTLGPALNDIAAELSSLSKLRKKPAGTIRINPILMGR